MHLLRAFILLSCFTQVVVAGDIWATLFKDNQERAEQGDADAQYETAIMFLKGQGVAPDRILGMDWLEKAAAQEHEKAQKKLAREKRSNEKFNALVKEAENGDPQAQYEVAMMLNAGRGVNLDHEMALNWFSNAADQGHKKSVTQKAIILFKGLGVKKDTRLAANLFLTISDTEVIAQYYLGEAYANGDGVTRDLDAAWNWYRKAADGGFGRAEGKAINIEEEIGRSSQRIGQKKLRKPKKVKAVVSPVAKVSPKPVYVSPVKSKTPEKRLSQKKKVVKKVSRKVKTKTSKKSSTPSTRPHRPVANTKPVVRVIEVATNKGYGLDHLRARKWTNKGKPIRFLPSSLNECVKENKKIVCMSHELSDQRAGSMIKYKVKSFISMSKGPVDSFTVTYKNLVLDVVHFETTEEVDEPGEEGSSQGFHVKTGWTRKHVAECTFVGKNALSCIRNGMHKMDVRARSY